MIHLYASNRTEHLLKALTTVIARPLANVFRAETIIVDHPGMARWLSREIAQDFGIAANIEFPLPAAFVWSVLRTKLPTLPVSIAVDRESLLWGLMDVLPTAAATPGCEAIADYLSGAETESLRYQLSRKLAECFDQYLVYRPEMIRQWESGLHVHPEDETEVWQADVWRRLMARSGLQHWAGLVDSFLERVAREGLCSEELPERISLFALASVSPGYLQLIGKIAEYMDVHVFMLNPSPAYWGDIESAHSMARLRSRWRREQRPDVSGLYDQGNALLASLGSSGRDVLNMWLEQGDIEHDLSEVPDQPHLLGALQRSIFELRPVDPADTRLARAGADRSIQVHSCHSRIRELQVLQDCLLDMFETIPQLHPHQVVISAPDIAAYAPYIEAVFGAAPDDRVIPYAIANTPANTDLTIGVILDWLSLPSQRLAASTVLGWLDVPAVRNRFDLEVDAVERIRQWIAQSGIRWGLDAEHRMDLGLPAVDTNSWVFGLQRLFLGYAMPQDSGLFEGIAPCGDIEGVESAWLGTLQRFIDELAECRRAFAQPAVLRVWQERINRLIDRLIEPDAEARVAVEQLRETLARIADRAAAAGSDAVVSADVLKQHLTTALGQSRSMHQLMDGRVSFCNRTSVRAVPFRVVCLLGLNDADFPRNPGTTGLDLIQQRPRRGDRVPRDDDRYLFLDALLCARDALHISYVGHSEQDNSERQPSVVVDEMLDEIGQGADGEMPSLRDRLLIEHPLQPFSPRNFDAGSYAAEWLERAPLPDLFFDQAIPACAAPPVQLSLSELLRFLVNPSRFFLQRTLGIRADQFNDASDDNESFQLEGLPRYAMGTEVVRCLVERQDTRPLLESFKASGVLPHGQVAPIEFEQLTQSLAGLADRVRACRADQHGQDLDILLTIAEVELSGRVPDVAQDGLCRYRPAKLKSKDLIGLWLEHLVLCAAGYRIESRHLAVDKDAWCSPLSTDDATACLAVLIDQWRTAQVQPLPLFARASFDYASRLHKNGDRPAALTAAYKAWVGDGYGATADLQDPWVAMAWRGRDPFEHGFAETAENLLLPLFDVLSEEKVK